MGIDKLDLKEFDVYNMSIVMASGNNIECTFF